MAVRDATPDDAEFLAWVMLTAARSHLDHGVWDYVTGWPEERILAYLARVAVTGGPHMHHHSTFLIAEVGGQPAAGLCAFDPDIHGIPAATTAMIDLIPSAVSEPEFAEWLPRVENVVELMPEGEAGMWVVDNVATAPEYRRRGLVDALMVEALRRGRQRGFTRAQIILAIGNEPARRAYLKHGFEHAAERREPESEAAIALGVPGAERLERDL
jgi:ribosomal protein S18 acetylase RimI-like enzyme